MFQIFFFGAEIQKKTEAATASLIMYIIYIINRAFLAPEAGAPKNQNYDENF